MIEIGKSYIQDNVDEFTQKSEHKIAVFLHPLLISLSFVQLSEKIDIQHLVIDLMSKINLNTNDEESQNADGSNLQVLARNESSLYDDLLHHIIPEGNENDDMDEFTDNDSWPE